MQRGVIALAVLFFSGCTPSQSTTKRRAHIEMGESYLHCGSAAGSLGVRGMMGGGMMSGGMFPFMGGGWGMMGGGYGGWSWIGFVLMLAFWGVILFGGFVLVRNLVSGVGRNGKPETALELLKKRFVAGEISGQEYENMKSLLK